MMKNVIKFFSSLIVVVALLFSVKSNFSTIEVQGFAAGSTIPCYSTFTNVTKGGQSTVDCVGCNRVNHTKDRSDRASCDSCGCQQ